MPIYPIGALDVRSARAVATDAFHAAVAAADPGAALRAHLPAPPRGRLRVVAVGKAAVAMATAVRAHYPTTPLTGVIVAPRPASVPGFDAWVGEHPIPGSGSRAAARAVLDVVGGARSDDLVLVLISGGASSLLGDTPGLDDAAAAALHADLLACGAPVGEINVVRRRLGRLAGGRLAAAAAPARVLGLILSDVIGDHPADVGSGPVTPDPTGDADALAVLDRWAIDAPEARARLRAGAIAPAPPATDASWSRVDARVIGGARASLAAAVASLTAAGWPAAILAEDVAGEARVVAGVHAAVAATVAGGFGVMQPPCALVSGGETSVHLATSGGRGGRNTEFALAFALALPEGASIHLLCADTDGIDGNSHAAGAFVDADLWRRASRQQGRDALARHDAAGFFAAHEALFAPGPTGTNVNDLRIVLIGAR